MKKHALLKILGILLLLVVIASYVLTGRQGEIAYIGLADILVNYFGVVLQNFCYIVLFVLVVGGFYGVLNKIPAYKKLLDKIVTSVKPLGKKAIFVTILLFAVIASLTGMTMQLIIFVPFVASIIILLGYDKLVALSSTIVSILIGYIGGVFVNFVNPNTYTVGTYEEFVGVSSKFANTFPKLLLLFAGITLLIYFVNKHIINVEKKKVNYELKDDSELMINEIKGDYKSIKVWPIITTFALLFVILVIGMIPWNTLFGITIFSDFHTWLQGLKIGNFAVLSNIFSANLPALGEWSSSGNPMIHYVFISMLILFMLLIIVLLNKVKFNEAIDNFVEGVKKAIPAAILITVAYTVLVCAYNNGFLENIISNYGKFNYGVSSLLATLGCLLNVDPYYIVYGVFSPIVNLITDESVYESVAILLQGIYGIFSIVGPTSLILIFGLAYMDVPYTTWLKYIWRFILGLIILLALVTCLVVLL